MNISPLKTYGHCEAKTKQSEWIISQGKALCESSITSLTEKQTKV